MSDFGKRLRAARKNQKVKLRELATALNTRIDTISRIELGKQEPQPALREKLEAFMSESKGADRLSLTLLIRSSVGRSAVLGQLYPEAGALRLLFDEIEAEEVRMAKSIEEPGRSASAPAKPVPEPQPAPSGDAQAKDGPPSKSPRRRDRPARHRRHRDRPQSDEGTQ